ncbi:MAG: sigma factor [Pirellulales bacterium]
MTLPLVREDLWRRFFGGDHDALVDIVRDCQADLLRRVESAILSIGENSLASRIDPLDLCQQIYLTLWTRPRFLRGRPVRNPAGYLHTLIRNCLRSELRSLLAARRDARFQRWSVESLETPNRESQWRRLPRRHGRLEPLDVADEVQTLLRRLNEPERRLTQMVLDGRNWQEIAARLPDAQRSDPPQAARAARMRFQRLAARLRRFHGAGR